MEHDFGHAMSMLVEQAPLAAVDAAIGSLTSGWPPTSLTSGLGEDDETQGMLDVGDDDAASMLPHWTAADESDFTPVEELAALVSLPVSEEQARAVMTTHGLVSPQAAASSLPESHTSPEERIAALAKCREVARQRWLKPNEVLALLERPRDFGLSLEQTNLHLPLSGTIALFQRTVLRNFRADGHTYRRKKEGKALDETHCKLKVDGVYRVATYHSWTTDSRLARHIYTLLDDKGLALVHYLNEKEVNAQAAETLASRDELFQPQPPRPPQLHGGGGGHKASKKADERVSALEAKLKQLEAENRALRSRASAQDASSSFGTSQQRDGGLPFPAATLPLAPPAAILPMAAAAAAAANNTSTAAALATCSTSAASSPALAVTDLCPDFDCARGGGRVLIAARTEEGFRYGGKFGHSFSAAAPATLVMPNVLSIRVPPSATGRGGAAPFFLLKLSADGDVIEMSPPYAFQYRPDEEDEGGLRGTSAGKRVARLEAAGGGFGGREDEALGEEIDEDEDEDDDDDLLLGSGDSGGDDDDVELAEEMAGAAEEAEADAAASERARGAGEDGNGIPREVFALALSLSSSLTSSANQETLNDQFRMLIASLDEEGPPPFATEALGLAHQHRAMRATHGSALSSTGFASLSTTSSRPQSRAHSSASSCSLASHLDLLDWQVDDTREGADADRRLRRLQQMIRQRLRHKSMPRSGSSAGGPLPFSRQRGSSGSLEGGEFEAAASQVQRVFRTRRQDSRRRAALAIERIYLRSRRDDRVRTVAGAASSTMAGTAIGMGGLGGSGADSGGGGSAGGGGLLTSATMADDDAVAALVGGSATSPQPHSPGRTGFEHGGIRLASAGSSSPMLHATGAMPPGPLQSLPEAAELVEEPGGLAAEEVVRQAQIAFRNRHLRRQAVRVIETSWSEYQYHDRQAVIAATGAEGAASHTYHARRRERAARVIQGYLQRQQGALADDGDDRRDGEGTYTTAELELLRRVQRTFRALRQKQEAEAEEVLNATRSASEHMGGDEQGYLRLVHILRKGQAATLSDDDRAHLARLQLAWRDHLEKKKRLAAPASTSVA